MRSIKDEKRLSNCAFFLLMIMPSDNMFKMFKNKKGETAGLMAGIGSLNSIISLISGLMGLMGGCGEDEGSSDDAAPPSAPEVPQIQPCISQGGTLCDAYYGCATGSISEYTEMNTGQNCCTGSCGVRTVTQSQQPGYGGQLIYAGGGDAAQTCAELGGQSCSVSKFCPDELWMLTSVSTERCCKVDCVDRIISAQYDFEGIEGGVISVEVRDIPGNYIIWYGEKSELAAEIDAAVGRPAIGLPYATEASCSGDEIKSCTFSDNDGNSYSVNIRALEDGTPEVVVI